MPVVTVTLVGCAPPPPANPGAAESSSALAPSASPSVFPVRRAMEKNLSEHLAPYFSLGVAMEPHYLGQLGVIIESTFNRLTAENAMKCARIHPSEDSYSWSPADQLANFARERQMKMTGHTLVWHRETPSWMLEGGADAVAEKLRQHISTVVARYADVTDNWDVVNEAVSDSDGKLYRDGAEGSRLFAVLGEKLVPLAFSAAQAAVEASGQDIELYYNDYNMAQTKKRSKVIKLARQLRDEGIRIDGVGAQAHWTLTWPSLGEVQTMIDDIVEAGFQVKISELDISVYAGDDWARRLWEAEKPYTDQLAQAQAARYKSLFEVFAKNAQHISSVTLWGLSDDRTWLDDMPVPGRNNYPLLFDDDDQAKAAYFELFQVGQGQGEGSPASSASERPPR